MSEQIKYSINEATKADLITHLLSCDAQFSPPLSERVDITLYSKKIVNKATRFEAWSNGLMIGLVAAYCNDTKRGIAFVTSVSVLKEWQGKGIASQLMDQCIRYVTGLGFQSLELEVDDESMGAKNLYVKKGFTKKEAQGQKVIMQRNIGKESPMALQRDYNLETKDADGHQYVYNFDFDVMHSYMLKSFQPFFIPGNLLELGSFEGDFTKRLVPYFDDITCVEASDAAIAEAKRKLGNRVNFINSLFETVALPTRYDNIVMTHVLEHLDNPIHILKRINSEWLSEGGRLFLVCPNANAPSRQIAVKMGLISHNTAVTTAEAHHGHRITYTLDTLERDARAAGLQVVYRSGIFFKALANFQWDKLLQTDIISSDYLEGCFQLGQQYPDLCSSIFLMCKVGK